MKKHKDSTHPHSITTSNDQPKSRYFGNQDCKKSSCDKKECQGGCNKGTCSSHEKKCQCGCDNCTCNHNGKKCQCGCDNCTCAAQSKNSCCN